MPMLLRSDFHCVLSLVAGYLWLRLVIRDLTPPPTGLVVGLTEQQLIALSEEEAVAMLTAHWSTPQA